MRYGMTMTMGVTMTMTAQFVLASLKRLWTSSVRPLIGPFGKGYRIIRNSHTRSNLFLRRQSMMPFGKISWVHSNYDDSQLEKTGWAQLTAHGFSTVSDKKQTFAAGYLVIWKGMCATSSALSPLILRLFTLRCSLLSIILLQTIKQLNNHRSYMQTN